MPGRSVAAAALADTCLLIVLLWTAGGGVLRVGRGVFLRMIGDMPFSDKDTEDHKQR